jgi:hypothetical protein
MPCHLDFLSMGEEFGADARVIASFVPMAMQLSHRLAAPPNIMSNLFCQRQ